MKKILLIIALFISIGTVRAATISVSTSKVDSVYICLSKTAYAYHGYECRGLSRCTHGIRKLTKAQAIKLGYRACKICYR
jgi:hypothetical protein